VKLRRLGGVTKTFKSMFAGMFLTAIGIDINQGEHPVCQVDPLGADYLSATALGTFALDLRFGEVRKHQGKI
jgi:TctA family transporter